MFLFHLRERIRARGGYTSLSKEAKINRTGLYKIVSEKGNPRLSTLAELLKPLGLRLSIEPEEHEHVKR